MNTWLIIPSYCEGQRLRQVLFGVRKFFPADRIIVVDDGSQPAEKVTGCIRLRHELNLGKGAAMKTGAKFAFNQGAQAIIFMDGDGQHDPGYLPTFIKYLHSGYDVVLGSRRLVLGAPLVRLLGNKLSSVYINALFGIYVSDILSGYRGLTKKAYQRLMWQSDRYGVETEIIARLGKYQKELRLVEFPIESVYIDKYKGVTIIDAIKILGSSLWWKLS